MKMWLLIYFFRLFNAIFVTTLSAKKMNTNDSEEYMLMQNFDILKTHLKIDCARFLGNVLKQWHPDFETFKESATFRSLNKNCQEEISNKNNFVLRIPVLCEVLLKGNPWQEHVLENSQFRAIEMQAFKDDIVSLNQIWKTHITENHHEKITLNNKQQLCEELSEIGIRMAERFPHIGQTYFMSTQQLRLKEFENDVSTAQIGNRNTMSISVETQMDKPVFIEQIGNKNKMIIQVEDRRQTKQLELQSTGEVSLRMVLRSNDTQEWKTITENATLIDIDNLNSNPVLKQNHIVVDSFEKGCLIVNFKTAPGYPIKNCLKILFDELFHDLEVEATLQNYNVRVVRVSGYIYYPEKFQNSKTCKDPFIIRHTSWRNTSTLFDIDIYLTNLMKTLIQNKFSTDVNEQIEVQIKWDLDLSMSSYLKQFSSDTNEFVCKKMKTSQLEIQNVTEYENAIQLTFKCTRQFPYQNFVEERGSVYSITKMLFSSVSTPLLRLSVFLDTSLLNDSGFGQGLVFYINPSSKVSEALRRGTFTKIITAMLGGEDTSVLGNVDNLKIKAILEYRDASKIEVSSSEQEEHIVNKVFDDHDLTFETLKQKSIVDPLFQAWELGNPNLVLGFLEEGGNPNVRNEKLQTPLHLASDGNLLRIVEKLLLCGAEIDVVDKNFDTPLILASRNGHWKIIESLLHKGSNSEIRDRNNCSPLFITVKNKHGSALKSLLKFGALVNSTGNNKETPLHVASKNGSLEIVNNLLIYGADVHCIDNDGNTPLHAALLSLTDNYQRGEIVKKLLNRGSLVNIGNKTMKTPVCLASENGFKDVTELLVKASADINLSDYENDLPIHLATRNGHADNVEIILKCSNTSNIDRCNSKNVTPRMLAKLHEDILKMFEEFETKEFQSNPAMEFARKGMMSDLLPYIKQNTNLDTKDHKGRSLLHVASCNGHVDIVRSLVNSKADVNAVDILSKSPLSIAAENKYYSVVECLINAGADANIVDSFGRTALHYAVKSGSNEILRIFLQRRHCVYTEDIDGKTPLHFCGIYGNKSIVEDVLAGIGSIDVNQCDLQRISPLHEAINNQQLDVAEFLLMTGANANFPNSSGKTPLHVAAEMGSHAAAGILLRCNGHVNKRDYLFQTPVFLAARSGRSVLLTLIKNGADINLPDQRGRTPLHVSLENGHLFVMKILMEYNAKVNLTDKDGKTPLHLASNMGNYEASSILLKANAKVNAVDGNCCTPLHYCTKNVVLKLLIQNGAFVNSKDVYGNTPLHSAVEFFCKSDLARNTGSEYLTIINDLLSNDADISLSDNKMETVIHKVVHASNYHLLIELLNFYLNPAKPKKLTVIVNDCLKQSKNAFVNDVLKRWVSIQQATQNREQFESMYTDEKELCPFHLLHQHKAWLQQHDYKKRVTALQRILSVETDSSGKEKRKRKVSIKDSTRGERLEKISKEEDKM